MTDEELQELKKRLLEERASYTKTLEASKESAEGMELDQQRVGRLSRMDALQSQAISQGANRRLATELQLIEAALKKFDDGTYGICESCGREIPIFRLDVYPSTPHCVDCASRQA